MVDEAIKYQAETLERHWLCRVLVDGTPTYKVLCITCRHAQPCGFKRISYSELVCDDCGHTWKMGGRGNLFVKDKTVTITARYPDLESARNNIS